MDNNLNRNEQYPGMEGAERDRDGEMEGQDREKENNF